MQYRFQQYFVVKIIYHIYIECPNLNVYKYIIFISIIEFQFLKNNRNIIYIYYHIYTPKYQ